MSPNIHFAAIADPNAAGKYPSQSLLSALTADYSIHLWRLNATLARIGEVLGIVNSGEASTAKLFHSRREAAVLGHSLHQPVQAFAAAVGRVRSAASNS